MAKGKTTSKYSQKKYIRRSLKIPLTELKLYTRESDFQQPKKGKTTSMNRQNYRLITTECGGESFVITGLPPGAGPKI